MGSIRLYSGEDGESHIEEIDPASHPTWTQFAKRQGDRVQGVTSGVF